MKAKLIRLAKAVGFIALLYIFSLIFIWSITWGEFLGVKGWG